MSIDYFSLILGSKRGGVKDLPECLHNPLDFLGLAPIEIVREYRLMRLASQLKESAKQTVDACAQLPQYQDEEEPLEYTSFDLEALVRRGVAENSEGRYTIMPFSQWPFDQLQLYLWWQDNGRPYH